MSDVELMELCRLYGMEATREMTMALACRLRDLLARDKPPDEPPAGAGMPRKPVGNGPEGGAVVWVQ